MKLKELKSILYYNRGNTQSTIIYDRKTNTDIENGCTIDCAIEKHGEKEVIRIEAFENNLLITV